MVVGTISIVTAPPFWLASAAGMSVLTPITRKIAASIDEHHADEIAIVASVLFVIGVQHAFGAGNSLPLGAGIIAAAALSFWPNVFHRWRGGRVSELDLIRHNCAHPCSGCLAARL